MFDCDVVIVGGGPAGLTAGLYLSRANRHTILLEKESFGGPMINYELIENYPGFANGISGAKLASEMLTQATKYGLQLEQNEIERIELFTSCRWVEFVGGKGFTALAVIIAGGSRPKRLGVDGEEELRGKGIFYCAFCDGGQFVDREIVVCGGGDAGVTEALYMTKIASKVILIEAESKLTAGAVLQERALSNPKLEIRCGTKVERINGDNQVKSVEFLEVESGQRGTLKIDGVLIHVGVEPNTSYLQDIVPLDNQGQIIVNDRMETEVSYILAAGDIRSGSPRQVVTAVGDGATAAISALKLLQQLS